MNRAIHQARKYVPRSVKSLVRKHRDGFLWSVHARGSFSQEGEDLLIERLTEHWSPGFYVDIGAHHPQRFSNTHLLHLRGWSGINIDATPGSMEAFNRVRPEAVNLELAIAESPGTVEFRLFDEPALNTIDGTLAERRSEDGWASQGTRVVQALPLATVLRTHVPDGVSIDVMSVDVEGADLAALRSNDWRRFRPRLLIVEQFDNTLASLPSDPISRVLASVGYEPVSKLVNSVVYQPRPDWPTGSPTR